MKQADKRVAFEIYSKPNVFIELLPTESDIWAINNLRQLYVCRDFQSKLKNSKEESAERLSFEPINSIFNVMNGAMGNNHQVIVKMVKSLDCELMVRPEEQEKIFNQHTSLSELCLNKLSRSLTLENCLDLYQFGDMYFNEELKINCLKFIALNIVSFFSEGSKLAENLIGLPIYLLKDLENFIKEKYIQKFLWLDMSHFEHGIDYSQWLNSVKTDEEALSKEICVEQFSLLSNMYQDFVDSDKSSILLREQICATAHLFRQNLRKASKRLKKRVRQNSEN